MKTMATVGMVILMGAGLAACGSADPKVLNSTPDGVSVTFDGSDSQLRKANEVARDECARSGRVATLSNVSRTDDSRIANFDCRRSPY